MSQVQLICGEVNIEFVKSVMPVQKGDQTYQSEKDTKQTAHKLTLTFKNNTRKALAHK